MSSTNLLELNYASYGDLDMYLDVHIPSSATQDTPAPIYLWFHGGGLLQGTRKGFAHHFASAPEKHNICAISPDYRLAPQARLPDIMRDCANVMSYIRSEDFKQKTQGRVDSSKVCVSGGSAGGWLALLVGLGIGFKECGLEPPSPPTSIASLYPISDLEDPFWNTKQEKVTYWPERIPDSKVAQHFDTSKPVLAFSKLDDPRSICYHYMIQEAILTNLLLDGINVPRTEFSIAPAIKEGRYVSLPPTYVTHGTIDDKVPIVQADDVVAALKEKSKNEVEYERVEGADHLFDRDEKNNMDGMYAFIKRHFQ